MEVQSDLKELLALFNEHKVKYVIVGGYLSLISRHHSNIPSRLAFR